MYLCYGVMDLLCQVQILDETVSISFYNNAFLFSQLSLGDEEKKNLLI